MTRVLMLFAAATIMLGIGAGAFIMLGRGDDPFKDCRRGAVAGGQAAIGGPFSLINSDGVRMTEAEAITKPTLLYFGYTFCPDFCPTDLARNALAADLLAERGLDIGQLFISVDPARDTPEAVAEFSEFIHPDLIGLTGTPAETAAAANAYRVYFNKNGDDPEFYLMDHSTFTYLVAPEVGFLEFFASAATPEEIADVSACFMSNL
jgi:protein SCO1/2